MRMRRVHLSIRNEGITAFSKRIRRCSVDGQYFTQYFIQYFIYLSTVKSSVKKKLIKTTLFYKIAVWEPDWQLL